MNSLFIGRHLIQLSEIGSTNDYAKELIRAQSLPEGTVISAAAQVAGRGQRGASWQTEPGKNLTASVVLFPSFLALDRQFQLNKAVSLALTDLVAELTGLSVSIKWPNDIFIGSQKVAGVLVENLVSENGGWKAIVGVGLNINQSSFPNHLPEATSMCLSSGRQFEVRQVLERFCELLEGRYLRLREDASVWDAEYLNRMYGLETWLPYEIEGMQVEARITGVNSQGKLLVQGRSEKKWVCDLKQIKLLRTASPGS